MSKIWLLLLLVAAIQLAESYPAPDDADYEFTSFEGSDEDRNAVGDWFKENFSKLKSKMKKVGKKCKAAFKKGKEILDKNGIKVDPLSCADNVCKSCIDFTIKKRKFCIEARFKESAIEMSLTKQKDEDEPKAVIGPFSINIGEVPLCKSLGKVLGPVCIQGVEGRIKSSKGKPFANFCAGALLKNYGVGVKFCIGVEEGKLKASFKPKVFAGDEEDGTIVQAGDSEDEGRPLDAVPEE